MVFMKKKRRKIKSSLEKDWNNKHDERWNKK